MIKNKQKILFLILTLIVGAIMLYPTINYQQLLSQGDHGRDLYAFKSTMDGQLPYQDYWWVYGPLMPYYYASFLKIFGVSIKSILIAKNFLLIITGLFFYLALSIFASPLLSFIGTLWFLLFRNNFFFTYNHTGGILVLTAIIYFLFTYLKTNKRKNLYILSFLIFILSTIKLNFGIIALAGTFIPILLADTRFFKTNIKQTLLLCIKHITILLALVFSVYFAFLHKLSIVEIRQCLPYMPSDHPYNTSIINSFVLLCSMIFQRNTVSLISIIFAVLVILSFIQTLIIIIKKQIKKEELYLLKFSLFSCLLFYLLTLHEFILSSIAYRSFWSEPFAFLLIFIIIATALKSLTKIIRVIFYSITIFILFNTSANGFLNIQKSKHFLSFLPVKTGQIYVGNNTIWTQTVMATTTFLNNILKKDETFFAVPYDPLYYFLTGKKSPTRQLIFFEHINISENQEKKIIKDLEENNVNYVVLSTRFKDPGLGEKGMGTFGITFCPLLGQYLDKNFTTIQRFGDFKNPPGWITGHGIYIMKRK